MIFEGLLNRGALPVLQQVMSFTEARHEVLANNISNLDTVGYKMKDLPTDEFFRTLDDAVRRRDAAAPAPASKCEPDDICDGTAMAGYKPNRQNWKTAISYSTTRIIGSWKNKCLPWPKTHCSTM